MMPGHAHKATYRGVTNDADPETSSNYWDNTSKDASVEKEMIENKFGTPRSEMYSLTFHPIDEDLTALIQARHVGGLHGSCEAPLANIVMLGGGGGGAAPAFCRFL